MRHADNFQLHIYAALREQEREIISKRTRAALAEARDRGVVLGGLRDKTDVRHKQRQLLVLERAEAPRKPAPPNDCRR